MSTAELEIVIHAGSCYDLLGVVPECEAMIVDPPYRAWVHDNATSAGVNGAATRKRDFGFAALDYKLRAWIAAQANRVQRWSVIYSDVESTNVWRHAVAARGAEYIRPIVWERWSQPQKSGDRPTTGCEMLTVFHAQPGKKPIRKRWNGPGSATGLHHEDVPCVVHHKRVPAGDRHPTEKPLDQLLDLVSWFSSPGGYVFDPCAGSGVCALACRLLGRGYIGAELQTDWAERARSRVHALGPHDDERIDRWLAAVEAETARVPAPKEKFQEKTYERAQRRVADAVHVARLTGRSQ